ncbi:hypothetical protein SAMN06269185_2555 [Natronoarchaeum philippinense]|uniref:Uncharacterized protein n=1 Tax=Natronoarchaeum philippinense TaxID=558529 RepID=A0A285P1Q7_NATPI|nr:hypothetical protein [Natronoarchaeum philippinense]SNZ15672.1 hypothetical protein SAMN06269185_2555 [Natronoarchaeum philippinense]
MRRTTTLMVLVALVTSAVAVPVGATGQSPAQASTQAEAQASANSSVAPGEQFAGVVGVTEAEFEGEVQERAFGVRIAQNASAEARSDVVGDQLEEVRQRVDDLEQRAERLREARDNGTMTEGEFRAEMAVVAAEKRTVANLTADTETVARGLPEDVLADNGVDVDAIVTLRERASELGGQNVSEIARSIAGPNVGATAQVDVSANGSVSVDVPGLEIGADADGDASAGTDNQSDSDADQTSVGIDSDTSVDADSGSVDANSTTDGSVSVDDGVSADAETNTTASL